MPRTNGLLDDAGIEKWILKNLGAPVVKVELAQCHLEDAVEHAKRWFAAKKGVQVLLSQFVSEVQSVFDLPDIVDTVLDVYFQAPALELSLVFSPFIIADEKVPYEVFAAPESAGIYSSLVQAFQYTEMAKRILSAETDWFQQGRQLIITPVPRGAGQVLILAKSNCVVLDQLNERDHDLVKRWSLAYSMRILARIRGKYVSANNPSINLGYICCDMHELPCLDDSFDYVFSIGVLEHAHDPAKAISEIFRVCSGRVYLDIDCANLTRDAGSHYTVGAEPEDWLKLCPPEAQLQWIYSGDVLCIRGEVE